MLLTQGNAAKLYCLNWIENKILQTPRPHDFTILDLGCGAAANFVNLLAKYENIRYTGIEPSAAACAAARRNLAGHNATIINDLAYNVLGRLVEEPFDFVVSFSVFEHVYQRQRYLESVSACLKHGGFALINYDAGHFISPATLKERIKNLVGPLFASVGQERYYQRFVPEQEFRTLLAATDLEILEAKSFNTHLKSVHKAVPPESKEDHMQRWLEHELWLNDLGIEYNDSMARTWYTRNFVLTKRSNPDEAPRP